MTQTNDLGVMGRRAKSARRALATLLTTAKNDILYALAEALEAPSNQQAILEANDQDVAAAQANGIAEALIERLRLTPDRLNGVAAGVRDVAALPDPVGGTFDMSRLPNGLEVGKRRTPIGVIGVIYESRPNVTIDIAALCLKSGNAAILRGGSETLTSNRALVDVVQRV